MNFCFFTLFYFSKFIYSKIKVSFLGSSVTAQKEGYVTVLQNLNSEKFDFYRYGYGGIGINPCSFDKAFENKPDLIVFDWAIKGTDMDVLRLINASIFRAIEENTLPIYLILPQIELGNPEVLANSAMIDNIKSASMLLNFSFIDLTNKFSGTELRNDLLYDSCHTKFKGAEKYASYIFDFLNENNIKTPLKPDINPSIAYPKFLNINMDVFKNIEFYLEGEIFAFFQKVGPYSNYIDIFLGSEKIRTEQIWDRWCIYERRAILEPNLGFTKKKVHFVVLNNTFERNTKENNIQWSIYAPKLHLDEMCYSGHLEKVVIDEEHKIFG